MINKKIAVLDLETTGLDAYGDEITEIGVVILDGKTGDEIGSFNTMLKVKREEFSDKNVKLTGITKDMTDKFGMEKDVVKSFLSHLLDDTVLVAHNVPFDFEFLKLHFGIDPKLFYDTLSIARCEYPELGSFTLGKLCEEFEIDLENAHRALDDARATADLLVKMLKERPHSAKKYINTITNGKYGIKYKPTYTKEVMP